jgi:hypothetical protein
MINASLFLTDSTVLCDYYPTPSPGPKRQRALSDVLTPGFGIAGTGAAVVNAAKRIVSTRCVCF